MTAVNPTGSVGSLLQCHKKVIKNVGFLVQASFRLDLRLLATVDCLGCDDNVSNYQVCTGKFSLARKKEAFAFWFVQLRCTLLSLVQNTKNWKINSLLTKTYKTKLKYQLTLKKGGESDTS